MKHAGPGATAHVQLLWGADRLTLTVKDTSWMPPPPRPELSSHYGLAGLTERVSLVGGRLDAGRVNSDGFVVRAELPLSSTTVSKTNAATGLGPQ